MSYQYRRLRPDSENLEPTKTLFVTAFPEEERPPFEVAVAWEKTLFYEISEDNEFLGLVVLLPFRDMLYIFFLAVEASKRGQGIGGNVLKEVCSWYPDKRAYLLVDEPTEDYPDYELRKRRVGFYKRNGFHLQEDKVVEYEVTYQMMNRGARVEPSEFFDAMKDLIGEELFHKYYF